MNEPKAVFFDMDGTLLDWQTGMEESWIAACEAHCDGSYTPAELHAAIRARRAWFWDDPERAVAGRMNLDGSSREIVRRAFADMHLSADALAQAIADDYRTRRKLAIALYPGAIETLGRVRARGYRTALITNGNARAQRESIERFGLARYFDCIVIEGEFGAGKPDERVFRHALVSCGVAARETWMIGDSLEADIVKPIELGMHAIWVNPDGAGLPREDHPRPHRIIRSVAELFAVEA